MTDQEKSNLSVAVIGGLVLIGGIIAVRSFSGSKNGLGSVAYDKDAYKSAISHFKNIKKASSKKRFRSMVRTTFETGSKMPGADVLRHNALKKFLNDTKPKKQKS